MRIVIQRVSHASVTIDGVCKSAIQAGFLILVGIEEADTQEDADWLCKKVIGLRVFDDEQGVMNRSILDVGGEILVNGFDQEREPPVIHPGSPPRNSHPAL